MSNSLAKNFENATLNACFANRNWKKPLKKVKYIPTNKLKKISGIPHKYSHTIFSIKAMFPPS